MALSLPVPTDFGVTATYHRLAAIQANWADGGCNVVLFSYIDQPARENGAKPIGTVQVTLAAPTDDLTRAALYAQIKEQAEWNAATDI